MICCQKCGTAINEEDTICTYCGQAVEEVQKAPVKPNQANSTSTLSIVSIALSAVGLVLTWFITLFGYGLGAAGLVCAIVAINKHPKEKAAKVGLGLSIASIGCAFLNTVIVMAILL